MNRKSLTFALTAAGITVGGLGVAQMASAQTADEAPENNTAVEGDEANTDGERDGRRGRGCHRGSEAVAEILGMEVDELRAALADGQSLSDIAEANGIDPQEVVDALVADATERLDDKVAEGDLTADEAAEKLADATERIEERIDEVRTEGDRPERGERRGRGGDAPDADAEADTEDTSLSA